MEYILKLLRPYNVDYNRHIKILTIQKPIEVSLFIYVKDLLYPYIQTKVVKDIRVETIKGEYERRF